MSTLDIICQHWMMEIDMMTVHVITNNFCTETLFQGVQRLQDHILLIMFKHGVYIYIYVIKTINIYTYIYICIYSHNMCVLHSPFSYRSVYCLLIYNTLCCNHPSQSQVPSSPPGKAALPCPAFVHAAMHRTLW